MPGQSAGQSNGYFESEFPVKSVSLIPSHAQFHQAEPRHCCPCVSQVWIEMKRLLSHYADVPTDKARLWWRRQLGKARVQLPNNSSMVEVLGTYLRSKVFIQILGAS